MPGRTEHYNLAKMREGDEFRLDGYKYTWEDREIISRLLKIGAETHVHDGAAHAVAAPLTAPALLFSAAGGTLPGGARIRYKFTLVDENGIESLPSPESYVDTPAPLADPAAPAAAVNSSGGTLPAGGYQYVLSAYKDVNTFESKATRPVSVYVPGGNANEIVLTLPSPPAGATGFNLYRSGPGSIGFFHLATIPAATAEYTDDGSVAEDCDRSLPVENTSTATGSVTITPPAVPAGHRWKVYRTLANGNWERSLLHDVVEESAPGVAATSYLDAGERTTTGAPPTTALTLQSPEKIDLTDAAHVTGMLPPGMTVRREVIEFRFDTAATVTGPWLWVSEHDGALITSARAFLGEVATTAVTVDVRKGTGAVPTFPQSMFETGAEPTIAIGDQIGDRVPTLASRSSIARGDSLRVDVLTGDAADERLTVQVVAWVVDGSPTVSIDTIPNAYATGDGAGGGGGGGAAAPGVYTYDLGPINEADDWDGNVYPLTDTRFANHRVEGPADALGTAVEAMRLGVWDPTGDTMSLPLALADAMGVEDAVGGYVQLTENKLLLQIGGNKVNPAELQVASFDPSDGTWTLGAATPARIGGVGPDIMVRLSATKVLAVGSDGFDTFPWPVHAYVITIDGTTITLPVASTVVDGVNETAPFGITGAVKLSGAGNRVLITWAVDGGSGTTGMAARVVEVDVATDTVTPAAATAIDATTTAPSASAARLIPLSNGDVRGLGQANYVTYDAHWTVDGSNAVTWASAWTANTTLLTRVDETAFIPPNGMVAAEGSLWLFVAWYADADVDWAFEESELWRIDVATDGTMTATELELIGPRTSEISYWTPRVARDVISGNIFAVVQNERYDNTTDWNPTGLDLHVVVVVPS